VSVHTSEHEDGIKIQINSQCSKYAQSNSVPHVGTIALYIYNISVLKGKELNVLI
jgi:hypothetical protein